MANLNAELQTAVRNALRKEFTDFFTGMMVGTPKWPNIGAQELVDAIADSLIEVGKREGVGIAALQTLVHELQDRINQQTN